MYYFLKFGGIWNWLIEWSWIPIGNIAVDFVCFVFVKLSGTNKSWKPRFRKCLSLKWKKKQVSNKSTYYIFSKILIGCIPYLQAMNTFWKKSAVHNLISTSGLQHPVLMEDKKILRVNLYLGRTKWRKTASQMAVHDLFAPHLFPPPPQQCEPEKAAASEFPGWNSSGWLFDPTGHLMSTQSVMNKWTMVTTDQTSYKCRTTLFFFFFRASCVYHAISGVMADTSVTLHGMQCEHTSKSNVQFPRTM